MVYLLGIVVVATRYGRGPSLIASILSVAALDFFFVPPVFTFAVTRRSLSVHVRGDAGRRARHQQPGRADPHAGRGGTPARAAHGRALRDEPRAREHPRPRRAAVDRGAPHQRGFPEPDRRAAARLRRRRPHARGPADSSRSTRTSSAWPSGCTSTTSRRGSARPLFPAPPRCICRCRRARGPVGVLGIRPADRHALDSPDQLHQLETFANQTALAIERAHLADEAQRGAGAHRDRAAAQLAAELGLARSANAAGDDQGRGHDDARQRREARRLDAAGAAGVSAGGKRSAEPPRAEPPGDDAARVRRAPAAPRVASARGGHRRAR